MDRDTLKAPRVGAKCVADDPRIAVRVTREQWQALALAAQQAAANFSKATPGGKLIRYKPLTRARLLSPERLAIERKGTAELRVMRIAFWCRVATLVTTLACFPIIFVVAPLRVAIPTLLCINAVLAILDKRIAKTREKHLALIDTTYRLGGYDGAPV